MCHRKSAFPGERLETDMIPNWVACKNEKQGMRRREEKSEWTNSEQNNRENGVLVVA